MFRARRLILLALLCVPSVFAATHRLYLKDGSYHLVREYKVGKDRIEYYSTERGDWEELPLDLVDLPKTEKEIKDKQEALASETAQIDAEDKAIRAQREEIAKIPMETGVFYTNSGKLDVMKPAEVKVVNNKKRSVLKIMSPIPIVAGKSNVEVDGLHAAYSVTDERPEFYIRLAKEEPFALVRLKPAKATRVVEVLNMIPVSNEIMEEREAVDTFKQQLAEGLYKIWPTKPLPPGEYAIVEYTEGKANIQVWDFSKK
jgi:hypothetical protein